LPGKIQNVVYPPAYTTEKQIHSYKLFEDGENTSIQLFDTVCKQMIFKGLNPDKSEITNYKHQIAISKSQIRSNTNGLEFQSL
jgi:hypothetical protein